MKKLMIAVSALALAVTSSAAQFFLKADATDLSLAESYSAGVLPGAGDEIVLDSGATYVVNDAALAVINGARELWLDNQTVIELDVADGSEITAGIRAFEGKVVKKNAGTVATKGTFSAALDVNAGRMKIRNLNDPKQMSCKYFRFSIAQIGKDGVAAEYKGHQWDSSNGSQINLRQLCLYAADGTRQNDGLVSVNDAGALKAAGERNNDNIFEYTELPAGSCAYDNNMKGWRQASSYDLANIFDSTYNNMVTLYIIDGSGPHRPDPSDPATWDRIVMRLKDDAKPVTHFDFELGYIENWEYNPITRFMLEASSDGANWQTVWSNVDGDKIAWGKGSYFPWLSGSTTMAQYDTAKAYDADYAYNVDVPVETVTHPYKWFRCSVAQIGDGADGRVWNNVRQFCLYSMDGARQNGGLTLLNDAANGKTINAVSEIPAGCAAWDDHMDKWTVINQNDDNVGNNALATLLGSQASKMSTFFVRNAKGTNVTPMPKDRSTWISFIMHLADGAKPVTHFDLELGYTTSDYNMPTRMQIEGSLDGKVWDVVWSNVEADKSAWKWGKVTAFDWMSGLPIPGNNKQGTYLENETYNPDGPLNLTSSTGQYRDVPGLAYKWYRCTVAQIGDAANVYTGSWPSDNHYQSGSLRLSQFCLYAVDGSCQSLGLKAVNDPGAVNVEIPAPDKIPAGYCAWDASMARRWKRGTAGTLDQLFDGKYNSNVQILLTKIGDGWARTDPKLDNPASWYVFVMHLADNAKPITHFDILGNDVDDYMPTRVKIEGSYDGSDWREVWSNFNGKDISWGEKAYHRWMSEPTASGDAHKMLAYSDGYAYNLVDNSVDIVPFKWFRYRIAQIGTNGHDLNVRQLGLYAKDGTHVNLGLKAVNDAVPSASDPATDYNPNYHYTKIPAATEIPAGCCAWDANVVGKDTYWDMAGQKNNPPSLARMFTDEGNDPPMSVYNVSLTPSPDNESSWIGIIMHLADDAQPVTHFDLCAGYMTNSSCLPTRMQLEGSLNGKDWVVVWSNVKGDPVTWNVDGSHPFSWLSGNTDRLAYWKNPKPYVEGDFLNTYSSGMELTKETALDSVKLGAGAELAFDWETYDLDAITVGAGAAATLENAWLAGNGVLTVEGLSRRGGEFSYPTLKDCIGSFANWSVVLDGINPAKYDVVVNGSKVTVTRKQGTMILVK